MLRPLRKSHFRPRKPMGHEPLVLNNDGAWCWFQDPRAIQVGSAVLVGSVSSGFEDPRRRGNVEVTSLDLESGRLTRFVLHSGLDCDDHAAPALVQRPDGRILAVYTTHGRDRLIRRRVSLRPGDISEWGPESAVEVLEEVCYSSLHFVETGDGLSLLDFHRGRAWNPDVLISKDVGETWGQGLRLLSGSDRPYMQYASDGLGDVHFTATDGHPRTCDNTLYHGILRDGKILKSDGSFVADLSDGPVPPKELTAVFVGDSDHVAWNSSIVVDEGQPIVTFSVQRGGAGLPAGQGGLDHRFHYGRWSGGGWEVHEMCFAGTRLYAGEDDYTGLATIHPDRGGEVIISTDADPISGDPLISKVDGMRHREILRGGTSDGGKSWNWVAITADSEADNLRPMVLSTVAGGSMALWMRGRYPSYQAFETEIVGMLLKPR